MGYSCAAKASLVLTALEALIGEKSSNALPGNAGFFEVGRENPDGAITGTVWKTVRKYTDEERRAAAVRMGVSNPDWIGDPARKAGSFRVSPEGKIERFPFVSKELKAAAEKRGAEEFRRIYVR